MTEKMSPEGGRVIGGAMADVKLTRDVLDIQVVGMERYELESIVKRYFKALYSIAEVQCPECEDIEVDCEHQLARKVLEIE